MSQHRKITFKLYPTEKQAERLVSWLRLHCELYNAALEERIDAYRKTGKSVSYLEQQNVLPEIKAVRPELVELGSQALQQTLRRLDLAFQAFFRRVKAGHSPGFPRFKSARAYPGFCYPAKAGWSLQKRGKKGATIKVGSGKDAMFIRARGMHRFGPEAVLNDLTITRRHGEWFASVTVRVTAELCARVRKDNQIRGFDLGVTDLLTFDDGSTVDNPRWLRDMLQTLAGLQRERARKKKDSVRYRRLTKQIARLHGKIANCRRDFLHKLTTRLVTTCSALGTEALEPKKMTRSAKGTLDAPGRRVKQKAGLNREILSAAFGMPHQMLGYKALEAGTRLHLANTRQLKPSQRCACCMNLVRKTLSERVHRCPHCGHVAPRDQNSAQIVLIDMIATPARYGRCGEVETADKAPKKSYAKSTPVTRETPTTALA